MVTSVLVKCLVAGKLYPIQGVGGNSLCYCGVGDIIHVTPEDAERLIDEGLVELFVYEYKEKQE